MILSNLSHAIVPNVPPGFGPSERAAASGRIGVAPVWTTRRYACNRHVRKAHCMPCRSRHAFKISVRYGVFWEALPWQRKSRREAWVDSLAERHEPERFSPRGIQPVPAGVCQPNYQYENHPLPPPPGQRQGRVLASACGSTGTSHSRQRQDLRSGP